MGIENEPGIEGGRIARRGVFQSIGVIGRSKGSVFRDKEKCPKHKTLPGEKR